MAGDAELDRVDVVIAHPEIRGAIARVSIRDYKEAVHGPVLDPASATRSGSGELLDHVKDEKDEEKLLKKVPVWAKSKADDSKKTDDDKKDNDAE